MLDTPNTRKLASVLLMGGWGGVVAYFYQMMKDRRRFSLLEFCLKIIVSCFSSWLIASLIDDVDIKDKAKNAIIGLAGFLGPETLMLLKSWYLCGVNNFFNIRDDPET